MNLDRDERCAICGLPRHAHWGAFPVAAGRCSGFQTTLPPSHRDEAIAAIEALLDFHEPDDPEPTLERARATLQRLKGLPA